MQKNINVRELMLLPPGEWRAAIDACHIGHRGLLENELNDIAQKAVFLQEYCYQRQGGGCGDQGHENSVKKANAILVKVRRAIGFAKPEGGTFRI